jgi:adenine-specific DNA-methyltransferase
MPLVPPEVGELENQLEEICHEHFRARNFNQKKALRLKDATTRRQIAKLLEQSGYAKESAGRMAAFDPYNQNMSAPFFDPHWMFGHDGFDIVIGNPPYVRHEKIKDQKPELLKAYGKNFFSGTADIYVYFFKRGLDVLNADGILSYICSNKYFKSLYGQNLRKHLLEKTRIKQLIDFGDADVFDAIVATHVILLQNQIPNKTDQMNVLTWNDADELQSFRDVFQEKKHSMPQNALTLDGWSLGQETVRNLFEQMQNAGTPLGEYVEGRFYYGIKTGFNEAFVVDKATRDDLIKQHASSAEVIKPFLRGRDVKRWNAEFGEQYLIKLESSENTKHPWSNKNAIEAEKIFSKTYPAIYKRLCSSVFREGLMKRDDQGHYFWELRSCVYWKEFSTPKILYQDLAVHQAFAWDTQDFFSNDKTYIIPNASKYLLAVLNSRAALFLFDHFLQRKENGGYHMKAFNLAKVPIPTPSSAVSSLITNLVNGILFATSQSTPQALLVAYLEQIINALVYELYLPEVLHVAGRFPSVVIGADPPPEVPTLENLQAYYLRVYDPKHEIRKLVDGLIGIAEIRIVEGKVMQDPSVSRKLEPPHPT